MPAVLDQAEHAAEQPGHQAAGDELRLQALAVVLAAMHLPVHPNDVQEDDQVHDPDENQKASGDHRARGAADAP